MRTSKNSVARRPGTLWLVAALAVLVVAGAPASAESVPAELEAPAVFLKKHGIEPNVAAVLAFVRQGQPREEQRHRIAALVKQLGSDHFSVREEAWRQLETLGVAAVAPLRAAAESTDPEVASRARRLLEELDQPERSRLNDSLLRAALQWLGQSQDPEATDALLDLLPDLPEGSWREVAGQALWARVRPADAPRLRRAVDRGTPPVCAAAIPALELAAGEEAVPALRGFLRDRDEQTRLAATRALVDRLPQPSIAALLELVTAKDPDVRAQAAWLLQQVSGIPPENDPAPDLATAAQRWKTWAATAAAGRTQPLGRKRLQTTRYGMLLAESFAEETGAIRQTYHQFQYETDVGGKASVARGVLRLDGHHAEGDQRLYISAEKLLGQPSFPQSFQIKATLGGEAGEPGAWHVGVSVGNIRVLFHPGLEGGGFRAERVDNRQPLFANEAMPFTPAGGVLEEMTIEVRKGEGGDVSLDVVVVDGAGTGRRHRHTLTVRAQDIGDLRRIGLERSGRTGGAALFGSLTIRQ